MVAMRLLPVLLLLLAVDSAATEHLPWPVTWSSPHRHTALDLAVDGSDVWTATGWGVVLQTAVAEAAPVAGTSVAVPGRTASVAARGGIAWAGSGAALYTIRPTADGLVIENVLPLNGTVSDLVLHGDYLFAGTSAGLLQIDLLNPLRPIVARTLPASAGGVISLAAGSNRLFAVDGDVSVDVYNISVPSLPQRVSEINAFPRNAAVSVAANHVLISDGRQTRIFTISEPASFVGTLATPVEAATSLGGTLVAAASGRDVRVWDLANPASAALLWSSSLPVTAGTVNRSSAVAFVGGTLIVAAGDAGQPSWALGRIETPYRTMAWRSAPISHLLVAGDSLITSHPAGGMHSWRRTSGGLQHRGAFEEDAPQAVADTEAGRFVAFSGATLTLWDHSTFPHQRVGSAQLDAPVRAAVLRNSRAFVLLTNGTGVTVDFTVSPAAVQPWDPGVPSPYGLAAAGDRMAVIGLEGNESLVRVQAFGGPQQQAVRIAGSATAGFAIDAAGRVAALTFAGLHLIDVSANTARIIPDVTPVDDLGIVDEEIALLRGDAIEVRRWSDGAAVRQIALPASFSVSAPIPGTRQIALGGETMIGLVQIDDAGSAPSLLSGVWSNRFVRDVYVEESWIYVRDARRMTRYRLSPAGSLVPVAWFDLPAGIVDVVIASGWPVLLDNAGEVTKLDWRGLPVDRVALPQSADFVPLNLEVAGGAVYASYRRGCTSGACEERTDVIDPSSMDVTASLQGGVVAATSNGNTAFLITQLPRELVRLDISDPLHPVVVGHGALESDHVSLAWDPSRNVLWILGSRLTRVDPVSLAAGASYLDSWQAREGAELSFNDQRVRVNDGVLLVTGRGAGPLLWPGGDPASGAIIWNTPAEVLRVEPLRDGFAVLTTHSIEIAVTPADEIRRGVRR